MSRVGRKTIPIPGGTKVKVEGNLFVAEGPKGKVSQSLLPGYAVEVADGEVKVSRPGDGGDQRAKHGLLRALLANAVEGASQGFKRELEIHGVGYRAEVRGRELHMSLGYSHPVVYSIPGGIDIEVDKSGRMAVQGADKQLVGQVAAEIRGLRRPDPYKAKGIKYSDEIVRRKVGKAGAK
ncbi:MAG: 50S ribosomal protein L6 [Thermoanaerobaculia bacterium]